MLYSVAILFSAAAAASPQAPALSEERVRVADDAFWSAFNACDRGRMQAALAPDIEFYHDKTGVTISRNAVVASFMNGPCSPDGPQLRRELVTGSLYYDPVPGFGAILTGRHRFYAKRDGRPEVVDGEARFAIVWQEVDGKPLMRRVLSYAHGPAIVQAASTTVVPLETLQRYVGRYVSPMGDIAISLNDGRLHIVSGGLSADLVAVSSAKFQAQGRPLKFEFVEIGDEITKVVISENGTIVAEGIRSDVR